MEGYLLLASRTFVFVQCFLWEDPGGRVRGGGWESRLESKEKVKGRKEGTEFWQAVHMADKETDLRCKLTC